MANEHEYDHEYMHAHNIPHEHDHGGHSRAHCPSAAAGCASDCANCDVDPKAELVALMRYMVNHNAAHANELAQLAQRLKDMGDDGAFEQVMRAVSDFEKGNLRLSAVLAALDAPKQ